MDANGKGGGDEAERIIALVDYLLVDLNRALVVFAYRCKASHLEKHLRTAALAATRGMGLATQYLRDGRFATSRAEIRTRKYLVGG